MRILFTFAGGSGHLDPLIPIARAAESAGHMVAFAGRPLMVPKVEALGFPAFASGTDRGLTPVRRPLVAVDMERESRDFAQGFAGRLPRERAADLLPLYERWRPDIVVWEDTDFGAVVVAERLGLAHAAVVVIAAGSFIRYEAINGPLNELRAEYGLPADPELTMLNRYLTLSPVPPSFRDPAFPLPATGHGFRPFDFDPAQSGSTPPWPVHRPGAPTVYFTLGTIFHVESGDLFERVIRGVRELPVNLVVTVGREIDPAEFGPQPANVYVTQYIPQAAVLPHCDLVISHGGSGSVVGTMAHGRPMVLIPMGADQPLNAGRCVALGLGLALDPIAATPEEVRAAVATVLADGSYPLAAERMRDEIAALPDPAEAVGLLERVVDERRPLTRLV